MSKRGLAAAVAFIAMAGACLAAQAAGVFIVSRAGVDAYNDAKAGFMQMAYTVQMQGFNPKSVDLDGSAADDAALNALKGQSPSVVFAVGAYAARKVRQAMPDVWIVYAMVYYPEVEGFTADPKMVGIGSLGSAKDLAGVLKTLGGKTKDMVVLYDQAIQASIPSLMDRLNAGGFDALAKPVAGAAGLQSAFDEIKDKARSVLVLPDPITANADALRYVISQCVENRIYPVSLVEGLVSNGVICAAFAPPDAIGNQAAKVAQQILTQGRAPDDKLVNPDTSALAVNKRTAEALKAKLPGNLRVEVMYE